MRIVVFGVGKIYQECKSKILEHDEIVAFLDNNPNLENTLIDGILVFNPKNINNIIYDKIVIMTDYALEIRQQLIEMGYKEDNILHYLEYLGTNVIKREPLCHGKNCLIITWGLGYHGSAVAAIYLAKTLASRNMNVTIIARTVEENFANEFANEKIRIVQDKGIQVPKDMEYSKLYDLVIVNTYLMLMCALKIAEHRNVFLWLHESSDNFQRLDYWKKKIFKEINNERLKLWAVSEIAKKNFFNKFNNKFDIDILPIGIPDKNKENIFNLSSKLKFAVIGSIYSLKQQCFFVDIVNDLEDSLASKCEFYLIGKFLNSEYEKKIKKEMKKTNRVIVIGEQSKEKMDVLYNELDVVVVPSLEETLSIVALEALMWGKVIIVSDHTGIAEYIKDKENGFICSARNGNEFKNTFMECINGIDKLKKIQINARKTYEEFFSMEVFENNLHECIKNWNGKR